MVSASTPSARPHAHIAEAIVAVLEMSWVTGQTVFADGGLALHSPTDSYGQVQRLLARRKKAGP